MRQFKVIDFAYRYQKFISYTFIAISVIVLFLGIHIYSVSTDESYQALCCRNYSEAPLAMMIFYFGKIWISVFGDNLLSLRVLCRVCYIIAIGASSMYIWKRTKNLLLTAIVILLTSLIVNIGEFPIFNWDTGAFPIEAISVILFLLYIRKPTQVLIAIIGGACGIMTAFRLPLVCVTLIALFTICYTRLLNNNQFRFRQVLLDSFIGICALIVTWTICAILMTGSLIEYINSFNQNNIVTGHSNELILRVCHRLNQFGPYIALFATIGVAAVLCALMISYTRRVNWITLIGSIVIVCGYCFCVVRVTNEASNGSFALMLSGIGLPFFLLPICWFMLCKNNQELIGQSLEQKQIMGSMIVLTLFLFLLGIGSDTPFQRWSVCFLFPLAIGEIWPVLKEKSKRVFIITYSISILVFLFFVGYKYQSMYRLSVPINEVEMVEGTRGHPKLGISMNKLNHIVRKFKDCDKSFAFVGNYSRYIYVYAFEIGPKPIFPMHNFHWRDGDPIILSKKVDYLI